MQALVAPSAPGSRRARLQAPLSATAFPLSPPTPAGSRPPDAYLAAQLAAGVDAQCPGHILALGQGQQQVVGDAAGPRRAPGAAARARRGRRRLRTAGRARRAEVVRGAGALREARALGRHGRRVVRVQQTFGRGTPGGWEQQGRAAGLRGAAHRRAHGTDPHPVPGRDGPGFVRPGIRAGRRCGLGADAATYSSPQDRVCRRSWARPPRGAKQERLPGARVARGDDAGRASWGRRPACVPGPPRAPGASLGAAAAIVFEVAGRSRSRGGGSRRSRGPERRGQDSASSEEPRSKCTSKTRSLGAKARATFRRRSGSCALRSSWRVCARARRAQRE